VLVDSDAAWLASVVDRLVVLHEGRIVYDGNPFKALMDKQIATYAGMPLSRSVRFQECPLHQPIVEMVGVSYSYNGETRAIDDVSLTIPERACTAIVGHNGSGKSTLAKLVAGLLKPSSGTVTVKGNVLQQLLSHEAAAQVGYIYQNPTNSFLKPTIDEEFLFNPVNLGREPYVSLADFGLHQLNGNAPWELSAGEQQRLAIASTMAGGPEIIIFDEPTLGQSLRQRELLSNYIASLQERGHSVILISHDMDFVARTGQYIHVLDQGRLVKSGTANQVLNNKKLFNQLGLPLPW
jgi:energy-coupling factor transport system ATP-binding protein